MKLEQQVSSLELSQKLKELGVKQESYFCWREGYHTEESFDKGVSLGKRGIFEGKYEIQAHPHPRFTTANVKWNERDLARLENTEYSAFTVAELGEMLPKECFTTKTESKEFPWRCEYRGGYGVTASGADTEADARAKMLIYLLENKLI